MSWLERVADRIHARGDEEAAAQGLVVTRLPHGRRRIHDPQLTAFLQVRRAALKPETNTHDHERITA